MRHVFLFLSLAFAAVAVMAAQAPEANYDESRVPPYTLPDPLRMEDGTPVTSPEQWRERRRPELLRLFAQHVYGRTPKSTSRSRFALMKKAHPR